MVATELLMAVPVGTPPTTGFSKLTVQRPSGAVWVIVVLETVGATRFTFGTGMPLRIPEGAMAKLDLLPVAPDVRAGLTADNLLRWLQ